MSGVERVRMPTRHWGKDEIHVKPSAVLLIPTPAQLARGQRIVDADREEQLCKSARDMGKSAFRHGWAVRPTVSMTHEPPSGKRTVWVERHWLAVRLRHEGRGLTAYGMWRDSYWHGGQVWVDGAALPTAKIGHEVLRSVIDGSLTPQCIMGFTRLGRS